MMIFADDEEDYEDDGGDVMELTDEFAGALNSSFE